jgi:UDP-3-O-[3-hydroxymyristoyl] glucosamine N-acyltransferase
MNFSLKQIAAIVNGTVEGNPAAMITGVAEIQLAKAGELSFLANPKYRHFVATTKAEALIVGKDFAGTYRNLIRVENPNLAFSMMIAHFRPELPPPQPGIHASAVVADSVILGDDVYLGPAVVVETGAVVENHAKIFAGCYIGQETRIGAETVLYPNVTVYHRCQIGEKVIIHSGTVIGCDGFGFVRTEDNIVKIPQSGRVVIERDVEIGANCAIDRGTLGDTVIGQGSKLDNLIQIAHNVKIGRYCFIAGQTGVAGSTVIEDSATMAGQVGIVGHIRIGQGAVIAAQSGVTKDVPPGTVCLGSPAQEIHLARRELVGLRLIPELRSRIRELEQTVARLNEKERHD